MASANGNTDCSGGSTSVPQWKRDLIQRRRQQNKVLASNGASVKLCTAVSGALSTSGAVVFGTDTCAEPVERLPSSSSSLCIAEEQHGVVPCVLTSKTRTTEDTSVECSEGNRPSQQIIGSPTKFGCQSSRGATCRETVDGGGESDCAASPSVERVNEEGARATEPEEKQSVARNMRLEADITVLSRPASDESGRNNNSSIHGSVEFENYENIEETTIMRNYGNNGPTSANNNKRGMNNREQECENVIATRIIRRMDEKTNIRIYSCETGRKQQRSRIEAGDAKISSDKVPIDVGGECESDSSEELQYGPGIVNRLKSKYLNLTLRETNKSRVAVQRFRRAASLEDLLDCEHEDERSGAEKTSRKYAKRNAASGTATNKSERYRNTTRGNESMKRARSVEALMRYNAPFIANDENSGQERLAALRREPVNDHIVLIDRTSVKIESRLSETDIRPKAINKPKRIKPLLAETERPPPDLVKTTMRLFEGSVKKLKPKGEVAVKVATFKTINDSYKAQSIKKVLPKPPVQPKPFVNGNNAPAKLPSSPKKTIINATKPIAEMTADNEERQHREGVVTETIVQSVSSVVSKFQRIEKSYTPTASPEPNYKLKFSPSPSPEPYAATSKLARSNENLAKSPPITPISSPRNVSPGIAPQSPKRDTKQQAFNSIPTSNGGANGRGTEIGGNRDEDAKESATCHEDTKREENTVTGVETTNEEETNHRRENETRADTTVTMEEASCCVDGVRAISKAALDNISKAGITMQYNFGDKSATGKTYLPGSVVTRNGRKSETPETMETCCNEAARNDSDGKMTPTTQLDVSASSSPMSLDSINDETTHHEFTDNEKVQQVRENNRDARIHVSSSSIPSANQNEQAKPIGAISSLALPKPSSVNSANVSHHSNPIANETITVKTIAKHPKYEASPPQKQIGIIRPLVSTKCQQSQQNLSNRELEKNLINRVKSIEQPTKVVVSLKSADEIQPVKKNTGSPSSDGGGLWDSKHWNSPNNTMVFNFSNRKDVPDYIENDGLIIRRKREKQKVGDGGVIVLDSSLDSSVTDDTDWEISAGPPSPCDVSFVNDNVLINGRSNLSKQPRNHKHRIQFDEGATRTFEYPSESSMLADEGTSVDGETSSTSQQSSQVIGNKSQSTSAASAMSSTLLGGGGLSSFTPSKVDLASEGFELGVTRSAAPPTIVPTSEQTKDHEEYLKSDEDAAAWGTEATADLLY